MNELKINKLLVEFKYYYNPCNLDYQQYVIKCFNYYKPLFSNENQKSNMLMNFKDYIQSYNIKDLNILLMIKDFNDPEIINFFESIIIRFNYTREVKTY